MPTDWAQKEQCFQTDCMSYIICWCFCVLQVLNSGNNTNAKKLNSLPVKESHKAAQRAKEETNIPVHKNLNQSKLQGSEVAGIEQRRNHPKQHKSQKRKMNDAEGQQKKQTDKRKNIEEAEKKPTEYVFMLNRSL